MHFVITIKLSVLGEGERIDMKIKY